MIWSLAFKRLLCRVVLVAGLAGAALAGPGLRPAQAGLAACLDAVVNTGELAAYLAQQAAKIGECGDKLGQSPPASAAVTVVLAGLYAAGTFDNEDSCKGLVGSTIGMLLKGMLEASGPVRDAFEKAFGKSAIKALLDASAADLADTLTSTPGLDQVVGLMTCGCTVIGTVIETANKTVEIAENTKDCASFIGDAASAFVGVLESGVDGLGHLLFGDDFGHSSSYTPCIRDDGSPIFSVSIGNGACTSSDGKQGKQLIMSYCPTGDLFNTSGYGISNHNKPVDYGTANNAGFCACQVDDALARDCYCPKGATVVSNADGTVQSCRCPDGQANQYGACIACAGPVYKIAGGTIEYCGCPDGKALGPDGQCVACGNEPGKYVDDIGYCRSFTCPSRPGLTLVSVGTTKDACTYAPACSAGSVWKGGAGGKCEVCKANTEAVYYKDKNGQPNGQGVCRSCAVNETSTSGGSCQPLKCTGTSHVDPKRPHQCVACQQTTTVAGVTMCLDLATSYAPGADRPDETDADKTPPCEAYVTFQGKKTCLLRGERKNAPQLKKPPERKAGPGTVKPGEPNMKKQLQAPSLDDIGTAPLNGSVAPVQRNAPGGGMSGGGFSGGAAAPMQNRR
jgi:hypothetical protein